MTISDFDGAFFWPAIRTFVANAGVEPISLGEPEDEVWRKIFAAAAAAGSPLSFGMTPCELMRAAYALAQGGGGEAPYSWANAEAQAWYTAAVTAGATDDATTLEKQTADTFVGALKASGAFAEMEQINYAVAWHPVAARIDMKTATAKGSYVGGALHYRNRGIFCDGVNDEFDTQFTPSSATIYLQDDACHGVDVRDIDQNTTAFISAPSSTIQSLLSPRNTADKIVSRVNSTNSTTITGTVSEAWGLTVANRPSSTTEEIYRNGASLPCNAAASTGRQTTSIRIGRSNTTYVKRQVLLFFAGGAMDATMQAAVNTAWVAVKSALGIEKVAAASPGGLLAGATTLAQVDQKKLPDGAYATLAGRGYPSTGLCATPDGKLWGGRGLGTMEATAGICRMAMPVSANDATISALEAEYRTDLIFSAIGYTAGTTGAANTYPAASSTQGMNVIIGGSAGNYDVTWVAVDTANSINYYCRANWNGSVLTGISCSALPGGGVINAVVPSDVRGDAWALNISTGRITRSTITGNVLSLGTFFLTMGGTSIDQVGYDETLDALLVTSGANGGPAYLSVICLNGDYGAPYVRKVYTLTDALGIEGIVYRPDWQRLLDINDQYTHVEASFPFNGLQLHGPVTLSAV